MLNSTIFWLLFAVQIVWGANYKKCNTSSWRTECPNSTKCSQLSDGFTSYAGECHCVSDNYEFNQNYKSDYSDYCVYVENRVIASKSSSDADGATAVADNPINAPSSHHIVGGILISICLVVIFTLAVIGVRKLQIRRRIRNLRMTQRNRPLYEDVMMGNDNDDPPLI